MNRSAIFFAYLVLSLPLISGCTSNEERYLAFLENQMVRIKQNYIDLGEHINRGNVKNAQMIVRYADEVLRIRPELQELTNVLRTESTTGATIYRALDGRIRNAQSRLSGAVDQQELLAIGTEANALDEATRLDEYNRALSDPLNVLADLSQGSLPRVDALPSSKTRGTNGSSNLGTGQQLVGNPHYGQWRTNSSGNSFWAWYGQYALLSRFMGGGPIGYDRWSYGRNYTYYHDWGRNNYTSPNLRNQQNRLENRTRQKFRSEGRSFNSPYATKRTGATNRIRNQKLMASNASRTRGGSASFRGYGSGGRGPTRGK